VHSLDDDLGQPVAFGSPPRRVVSLVPSLTEALAASAPGLLVGATDWCSYPGGLDVVRVRGTKNPDHAAIGALRPDLVVTNQEENRRIDVERLRAAGVPVWVTAIESVDQALRSLRRLLVDLLDVGEPPWLSDADASWSRPPDYAGIGVVVPIWRDPWMVVGSSTFAGDMVARLGLHNLADGGDDRYPKRTKEELVALGPELVLFPDEPYPFSKDDGPADFPGQIPVLVSGRDLTWYGPSMATARTDLVDRIDGARAGGRRSPPRH
jgi:ABC-type Fe3+-hydroxamate transport system substrate-binding protein